MQYLNPSFDDCISEKTNNVWTSLVYWHVSLKESRLNRIKWCDCLVLHYIESDANRHHEVHHDSLIPIFSPFISLFYFSLLLLSFASLLCFSRVTQSPFPFVNPLIEVNLLGSLEGSSYTLLLKRERFLHHQQHLLQKKGCLPGFSDSLWPQTARQIDSRHSEPDSNNMLEEWICWLDSSSTLERD